MDAGGRYATRLRVAQETVAGGAENIGSHAVPGKRALRQSQRVGAVGGPAKRALGDITNNLSTNGPDRSVLNGKKATEPAQRNTLNPKLSQRGKNLQVRAPSAHAFMDYEDRQIHRSTPAAAKELDERLAEMELRNIVDIDARDADDHLCCSEYVKEIYQNLYKTETRLLPEPDYMENQEDISYKMRSILIDWLVDVHQKFKLCPDTLFLTVNVVDRFLSKQQVRRSKLQLVGVTSMLIASKYHEIYAPETSDFVYISDHAYTKEEILKMEATMLNMLGFEVTSPSPFVFLARTLKAANANKKTLNYASYCLEMAQQEYRFVGCKPSKLAATACYIAGLQCSSIQWNETMEHYSGFKENDLQSSAQILHSLLGTKSPLTAIRRKYAHERHLQVATMPLIPFDVLPRSTASRTNPRAP